MDYRIRVLDGWRGASILIVLLAHLVISRFRWVVEDGTFHDPHRPLLMLKAFVWRLSQTGGLFGVSMFFIISGFIITTLLLDEERKRGQVSLVGFYLRRAFRILPALALYIAVVGFGGQRGWLDVQPGQLLYAATFTCNVGAGHCGWFLGHLWTLAVEEQFYVVWPVLFVLLGQRRIMAAYGLAAVSLLLAGSGIIDTGGQNGVAAGCITIGVVLALDERLRRRIEAATSLRRSGVAALICGAHGFVPEASVFAHIVLFLFPIAITFIFAEALKPTSSLCRIVSNKPFLVLGLFSYSIYLWQQLFMGHGQPFALLPIAVVSSFYLIEKPFIRLGRRMSAMLPDSALVRPAPVANTQ